MSDPQQDGQPEPTMEEILSSIRRIISDDDPQAAPAAPAAKKPDAAKPPLSEPDAFEEDAVETDAEPGDEEVLELTQVVNEDGSVTGIDEITDPAMIVDEPEPEPEPVPEPEPEFAPSVEPDVLREEPILGEVAARATAAALNQLVVEMPKYIGIGQGLTLEDITRELLRPMMKEWLDTHLPATVERLVQEEIARVSRLNR